MVQSGQGADEVFGGYHWYPKLDGSATPVADYLDAFATAATASTAKWFRSAILPATRRAISSRALCRPRRADPVDQALRLDTTVMLVDDPVKRVDNMTMAFGLEARVPFLDHELVELAAESRRDTSSRAAARASSRRPRVW